MESEVVLPSRIPVADGSVVQAQVALVLLRALQDQDRPGEVLDHEVLGVTLPRRFGLTNVVADQIRRYEREARLRRRVPEAEIRDLIRLIDRRPDSESLFRRAGHSLAGSVGGGRWRRILPRRVGFALARRSVVRRLRRLLGSSAVRVAGAPFQVEMSGTVLLEGHGTSACALVAGFSRVIMERFLRDPLEIDHVSCRAKGDPVCLWTGRESDAAMGPEASDESHKAVDPRGDE